MFLIHRKLGPTLIMIKEMVKNLFEVSFYNHLSYPIIATVGIQAGIEHVLSLRIFLNLFKKFKSF